MNTRFSTLCSVIGVTVILSSCKPVYYNGNYGQINQTQVVLNGANFRVLGSFTGTATKRKKLITVKNKEGLIALAKANFLQNAKSGGVDLTGSRALVNVTVDIIQNLNRITVTFSADIIEFTK